MKALTLLLAILLAACSSLPTNDTSSAVTSAQSVIAAVPDGTAVCIKVGANTVVVVKGSLQQANVKMIGSTCDTTIDVGAAVASAPNGVVRQ